MDRKELTATLREETGKKIAKAVRENNQVPAVIYGYGDPVNISVDDRAFRKVMKTKFGRNIVIDLKIGEKKESVVAYQVDMNALKRTIRSIDFKRVDEKKNVNVSVPLEFTGIAPGVKMGGILIKKLDSIKISCLPSHIPASINIDLSNLKLDQHITIGDLKISDDIEIRSGLIETIVRIEPLRGKTVDEEIAEEAAAAAENEATEESAESEEPEA